MMILEHNLDRVACLNGCSTSCSKPVSKEGSVYRLKLSQTGYLRKRKQSKHVTIPRWIQLCLSFQLFMELAGVIYRLHNREKRQKIIYFSEQNAMPTLQKKHGLDWIKDPDCLLLNTKESKLKCGSEVKSGLCFWLFCVMSVTTTTTEKHPHPHQHHRT